jgi:hypothetical protein
MPKQPKLEFVGARGARTFSRVRSAAVPLARRIDVICGRSDDSAGLESELEQVLGKLPIAALAKGGFLKVMPYSISVK